MNLLAVSREKKRSGVQPYSSECAASISRHLKKLCDEYGQNRVGEMLGGVDGSSVNRWKNGEQQPQLATLIEMRRVLRLSIDEILGLPPFTSETKLLSEFQEFLRFREDRKRGAPR